MLTDRERIDMIHKRTAQIKLQRNKQKQNAIDSVFAVCTILLCMCVGSLVPELLSGSSQSVASSAASLLVSNDSVGYILMALLSFLLGICFTVLLYRLRRRLNAKKSMSDSKDEL